MLDDTWVCSECCASNIEEKVWVKINSYQGSMAEVTDSEDDTQYWCPECQEHTAIIQYSEFCVEDDTKQAENTRLDQIISESDKAMERNVDKWNNKMKRRDK